MNYINRFINVGVTTNLEIDVAYKVRLSNIFLLSTLPLYVIYLIYGLYFDTIVSIILSAILILFVIVGFYLNHKKHYLSAKVFIFFTDSFCLLFSYNIFNLDKSMLCYYFPLFFAFVTFYNFKEERKAVIPSFIFSICCLIAAFILPKHLFFSVMLSPEAKDIADNYINYIFAFSISIFFIGITAKMHTDMDDKLVKAKEEAINANKAKSQFLSTMSHELRTPLNGIMGATSLIIDETDEALKQEYYDVLQYSSEHMLKLINEILDFSKVEAGKIQFDKTIFNLQKTIKNVCNSFRNTALKSNVKFKIEIDEGINFMVESDELRLIQILNNLLSNAFKFTTEGSVMLQLFLIDEDEKIATVKICVKDTGIGIKEENIHLIFKSFTQAETGTTRKFGGTGLGLTISSELVKLFDSILEVNSKYNEGSTFSFVVKFLKR